MNKSEAWAERRREAMSAFNAIERERPAMESIYVHGLGWVEFKVDNMGRMYAERRGDKSDMTYSITPADARKLIDWYVNTFGDEP